MRKQSSDPINPADVIGNAVKVMRIATGEEEEDFRPTTARTRRRSLWGGVAAKHEPPVSSAKRRAEIAREAAKQRWAAKR
jgi:hypothetical protein